MRLGKDTIAAGTDHWCRDLWKMSNTTIAGTVSTVMSMELTDRRRWSSKTERQQGKRTVRSKRKKHTEKTENLNTATSRNLKEDKKKGRKEVVLGEGRVRKLHTGSRTDMKSLENDDQLVPC